MWEHWRMGVKERMGREAWPREMGGWMGGEV